MDTSFSEKQFFGFIRERKEEEAYTMLYELFSKKIFNYTKAVLYKSRCSDLPDHIKDVNNDIWLRGYKYLDTCKENPEAWLIKLGKNICLDHISQSCQRIISVPIDEVLNDLQSSAADLPNDKTVVSNPEIQFELLFAEQLIQKLSSEEQFILRTAIKFDLNYELIGIKLNVNKVNARQKVHRIRRKLNLLKEEVY